MTGIVIAIDGGAGAGKGTTAKGVAQALGYTYVDTGAMYRAVTLRCLQHNMQEAGDEELREHLSEILLTFEKTQQSGDVLHICMNGIDIESNIRTPEIDRWVAVVSARHVVREYLVSQQRLLAIHGGVVMEGRDIATVVAPGAELKIFLTCNEEVRAKRRHQQFLAQGKIIPLEEVRDSIHKRDELDYGGQNPTSTKADDARELDTTHLTIEEQIDIVLKRVHEVM